MTGRLLKQYFIGMFIIIVSLGGSLMISDQCDAKVFCCESHDVPKKLEGEFIAVYNVQNDQTVYYDSEEIEKMPLDFNKPLEPELPALQNKIGQLENTLTIDEETPFANTLTTSIADNRIKVSNVNAFPFYSTARITTTFSSTPGYQTNGSAYELYKKVCATAGHVLVNSSGEYFSTLKVEFGYNNGKSIYTMTQNDLKSYVLHGEFKGTNWRPQIDYAFLEWNRNITDYVGHFGISWSYSPGDICFSAGYPFDKNSGQYMYYSKSVITSIENWEIKSNNYNYPGQSGSPLYLQDGYAIGIVSGKYDDNSMVSVQLDVGITTWLHDNGYFD